ncbi:TonB-dependent receptor domain-containing protein [Sandarakinorhabdus sp.]|uniref:TonB-dependent receptor n=1 Tax=Sandarakinorhabdus sp. TaxID=1916663 RepID=UPI00286DFB84|nr:TonB-dependent receptor [Sandarakinorhabdus sp.]
MQPDCRAALLGLLLASPASAQDAGVAPSLPASALITVTAPAPEGRVLSPTVRLDTEALEDRQPRSIADALRGLPGVSLRTNSRGETVARVRGSEERQTQVFLDGAPLSVPWDGRIDLGLIPAGVIGSVSVRKGAVPIEYGANAVAGVVDLQSRREGFSAIAQAGNYGLANVSGAASVLLAGIDLTIGAAHQSQDAQRVADPAALPFSQTANRRRTNTKSDANSLFVAAGGALGAVLLRASVLHFSAARGIAPESDRDPALAAPRYWRYPAVDFAQAQISASADLDGAELRGVLWRQWFGQTIAAYRSADYAVLRGREDNDDDTLGGRATLSHGAGPVALRWSASAQQADHIQRDTAFPTDAPGPSLAYRQTLFSLGAEADVALAEATHLTVGLGHDWSANPRTGDKPAQPVRGAWAFSAGLRRALGGEWQLSLTGGRRTRFASARELFGESLGRFLPNPGLRPERIWSVDGEIGFRRGGITLGLNPFYARTDDGIGQRVISDAGLSLRQRFNQPRTTSFGVDALALFPIGKTITLALTGTWLNARDQMGAPLLQRPSHEAMLAFDWAPSPAFDMRAEWRRIGPARDLGAAGDVVQLPAADELNLRATFALFAYRGARVTATLAIDNLTDALVIPQSGLPAPGRTLRLGLRLSSDGD